MLRQHRPFWPGLIPTLAACLAMLAATGGFLAGCASTNAVATASDLEQKAYAVYGTFVIVEEQGAKLIGDPAVSTTVKDAVRGTDAKAKPTADTLVTALHQYENASAALKSGNGSAAQLTTARANLATWITQAATDVNALVSAVKGTAP